MKKHFLSGLVAGTMLCFAALFVLAQWWPHVATPYAKYYVQLDMTKSSGRTLCEVYSGLNAAKRVLPMPAADDDGHIRNCVLEVTGELSAEGGFNVRVRPGNPLDVQAWKQSASIAPIQKRHIVGLCTEAEYLGVVKTPSAQCTALQLSELPVHAKP